MSRETIFKALNGLADEFKYEALELTLPVSSAASGTEDTITRISNKTRRFSRRVLTIALVACLILALAVTAYAVGSAVNSPKAVEKVAREELKMEGNWASLQRSQRKRRSQQYLLC